MEKKENRYFSIRSGIFDVGDPAVCLWKRIVFIQVIQSFRIVLIFSTLPIRNLWINSSLADPDPNAFDRIGKGSILVDHLRDLIAGRDRRRMIVPVEQRRDPFIRKA